ncbi:MAG: aldo/keto reductase [Gammaproteobacteria bacterium]|nr:aldo/keto reductase [Gammaproteobacteria bacterium]
MLQRQLGHQGLTVSAIGLGCMGMSDFYGSSDQHNNLRVLAEALALGVSFWDSADMYGLGSNEALIGQFFASHPGSRQRVQLATKFGIVRAADGSFVGVNGRPDYVKQACDASLKRLGVEQIDLYYQHRVDPQVPIEETVGAMAELVTAGKVNYIGLSEASSATIERAHRVHPLSAVQSEYSLWTRDIEAQVLPTCQRLGIGLVPYSPLGRGFLTGAIRQRSDLAADDWRLQAPRFAAEHFDHNLQLVDQLTTMAASKGCTQAQLALAWLLAQDVAIAPIPGTRSMTRLAENAAAAHISLTPDDLAVLDQHLKSSDIIGERYPEAASALLLADTPAL